MARKRFSLTDTDLMPYGVHSRDKKQLKDVDDDYLRYIYHNHNIKKYKGLIPYIEDRLNITK